MQDKDIEFIKLIYNSELSHKEKIEISTKRFGVTGRAIRDWWQKLDLKKADFSLPTQLRDAIDRTIDQDVDVLLITSCQNKTLINTNQLESMVKYKEFIDKEFGLKAEIVVIPSRYRNPTSPKESINKQIDQWWVDEVNPYLYYSKLEFGDTIISADSRISPTASNPLNGYESLAFDNHLVLGHSRIHYKVLPRFRSDDFRVMCTTGFISNKNYSSSKSGDKAFIHHSYGFTVVEKDKSGKCLPPRNVKVNFDGSFTDILYEVTREGVSKIESSKALVWGDIHHAQIDRIFLKTTLSLCSKLNPNVHVLHDLFDGESINPHEEKDMFIKKLKIKEGRSDLEKEVDESIGFAKDLSLKFSKSQIYVVESNHDNFLDRHINNMSWKRDLYNSEAYLKYALIQQTIDLREHGNIFGHLVNTSEPKNLKYLRGNESLRIDGYQMASHGDKGTNGSRGTINTFKKYNTKMIHAHTHTPSMIDGVTCVGVTCKLWQYYNSSGMSSWANAHSVVHNTGKNQLLVFDNDYRLSLFI